MRAIERQLRDAGLDGIYVKVCEGRRLDSDDGLRLNRTPDLTAVGFRANLARERQSADRTYYVRNLHINYSNICNKLCKFCSFYAAPNSEDGRGYVLPRETIFGKIEELLRLGGTEILIQGGLNPTLRLDFFESLFRDIKANFPVQIHGLSPVEIIYLAKLSGLSQRECLVRLWAEGLDSIPGAGAEILVEAVREEIAPYKNSAAAWLELMRTANQPGIGSSVTMMYGSVESVEQRVEHLVRVRDLQDETGGFRAFIPWSFQPEGTHLGEVKRASGFDYLRTVAISRLMLDNVPNIQSSWLTQGPKLGQIALQ